MYKKLLFLLLMVLGTGSLGMAQPASYRWQAMGYQQFLQHTGFRGATQFSIPTADGGMFIGTRVLSATGSGYVPELTKVDLFGSPLWSVEMYDGSYPNYELSVTHAVELPGDGFYVLGYYNQSGGGQQIPDAAFVSFITYNAKLLWTRLLYEPGVSSNYQRIEKGYLNPNGELVAVGIDYDPPNVTYGYLTVFDPSGNQVFVESDYCASGASLYYQDVDETVPGECISIGGGGQKLFLVHRDNNCTNLTWHTSFNIPLGGGSYLYPEAVGYDKNSGGYFLAGYHTLGTLRYGWVAYADPGGALQWVKRVAGPQTYTVVKDLVVYDGRAFIVGSSYQSNFSNGLKESFLAEIDDNGNLNWAEEMNNGPGSGDERLILNSIENYEDPPLSGNTVFFQLGGIAAPGTVGAFPYIATHLTYPGTAFDACDDGQYPITLTNLNFVNANWPVIPTNQNDLHNYDWEQEEIKVFPVDLCGYLKTRHQNAARDLNLEVYPNPATERLTIATEATEFPLAYQIDDLQGRTLHRGTLTTGNEEISLPGLSSGIYFVRIATEHGQLTEKFTIAK
ncbi:MAG: T9SS type A sorting domain-containing protein [Bacteroidota bacterium]